MKTWKPDTCDCLVEEIYNGNQIVGAGQVLYKCAAHASVPDDQLYGVLYSNPEGENKRKNHILRVLLGYESVKGLGLGELNADGQLVLKAGVEYRWSWTDIGKDRILAVQVVGATLTINQKNAIQTYCDTKFGVGKVTL